MSNNLDSILDEVNGFVEVPVAPKAEAKPKPKKERAERAVQSDVAKDPAMIARRRADIKFIGRCISGAVLGAGSIVAMLAGLMDPRLATAVTGLALTFIGFWAGAWLQFRFFDGGLLND